jgi:imidazole glycerol-phosphate synthase subunit HisH
MPHSEKIKVVIVDYEAGNLFSVLNACKTVGLEPIITSKVKEIVNANALILPGVGAFGAAMDNLHRLDLIHPLRDFAASGKPFMGICLGMQLLFSESEEFGNNKGLNLIEGAVLKFSSTSKTGKIVKVPQIGWNQIFLNRRSIESWDGTPLEHVANGDFMYFVHSYYACPVSDHHILSITDYGGVQYCSSVVKDNLFATQFHPEKSGKEGMKIYQYWANSL